MIPKLIDNSDVARAELFERVSQTHASDSSGALRRVSDQKKDREEDQEQQRDSYEHQPPREEDTVDFAQTLRQAAFGEPNAAPPEPGAGPEPTFPLLPPRPEPPADERGRALDLEA